MSEQAIPEVAKLQLQQSIETYRVQMSLLVQICTVLVLADATTVGYAVQQRLAGILWVGLIFPITMYLVIKFLFRMTLPIIATAVGIEARYQVDGVGGLMSTFVATTISPTFFERLRSAALIEDERERNKRLSGLRRPAFAGVSPTRWLLWGVLIGQLVAPLLLRLFAHWSLLAPLQ